MSLHVIDANLISIVNCKYEFVRTLLIFYISITFFKQKEYKPGLSLTSKEGRDLLEVFNFVQENGWNISFNDGGSIICWLFKWESSLKKGCTYFLLAC